MKGHRGENNVITCYPDTKAPLNTFPQRYNAENSVSNKTGASSLPDWGSIFITSASAWIAKLFPSNPSKQRLHFSLPPLGSRGSAGSISATAGVSSKKWTFLLNVPSQLKGLIERVCRPRAWKSLNTAGGNVGNGDGRRWKSAFRMSPQSSFRGARQREEGVGGARRGKGRGPGVWKFERNGKWDSGSDVLHSPRPGKRSGGFARLGPRANIVSVPERWVPRTTPLTQSRSVGKSQAGWGRTEPGLLSANITAD